MTGNVENEVSGVGGKGKLLEGKILGEGEERKEKGEVE